MTIQIPSDRPIMLVEDDPIGRLIFAKVVERSALANSLIAFESGEEAIDYLRQRSERDASMPCVVFLDVNMPGMGGFEVLEQIKSGGLHAKPPTVIMLTSSDAAEDREDATRLGADLFLTKQAVVADFVRAIESAICN